MSWSDDEDNYSSPFPIVQLETEIAASVPTCLPTGVGCTLPPPGAKFYPFYSLVEAGYGSGNCALVFGNETGNGVDSLGGIAQYGVPNLPWFFATDSGGPRSNFCLPNSNY